MNLRKYFIKFSLIFFVLLLFSVKSFSVEPDKFIQSITDEASKVLVDNFSKDEKMEKLKAIALKSVDIKGIGLYSLGSHRKSLSDSQKEKYNELFKKYFLKSFSSRLSDYTDPKINVLSMEKINDKYTIVSSILIATEKMSDEDRRKDRKAFFKSIHNTMNHILLADLLFIDHHYILGQWINDQGSDCGVSRHLAFTGRAGFCVWFTAADLWQLQLDGQHFVHSSVNRPFCNTRDHGVLS